MRDSPVESDSSDESLSGPTPRGDAVELMICHVPGRHCHTSTVRAHIDHHCHGVHAIDVRLQRLGRSRHDEKRCAIATFEDAEQAARCIRECTGTSLGAGKLKFFLESGQVPTVDDFVGSHASMLLSAPLASRPPLLKHEAHYCFLSWLAKQPGRRVNKDAMPLFYDAHPEAKENFGKLGRFVAACEFLTSHERADAYGEYILLRSPDASPLSAVDATPPAMHSAPLVVIEDTDDGGVQTEACVTKGAARAVPPIVGARYETNGTYAEWF